MKKQDLQKIIDSQKNWFNTQKTLTPSFRLKALYKLKKEVFRTIPNIHLALSKDLGLKCEDYCIYETEYVIESIDAAIKRIKKHGNKRLPSAYGITLVISGKYSPFINSMIPLIHAISRGDTCIIKPSSKSGNTANLINDLIEGIFPAKFVFVLTEGRKSCPSLLSLDFDYLFFSGRNTTKSALMKELTKRSIPFVFNIYEVKHAEFTGNRIRIKNLYQFVLDKFLACGQYQNSPDYIVVTLDNKSAVITKLTELIEAALTSDPLIDEDYGRICDLENYNRLSQISQSYPTLFGGARCEKTLQIGPLIIEVNEGDPLLKEKIFGPIIPIVIKNN